MSDTNFIDDDGPLPSYPRDPRVIAGYETSWWQDVNNATYRNTLNVKHFGAKGDGVTDDTAAIEAADAAACNGTLGLDGVTVLSQAEVYFPPGIYKASQLTYRGAPWRGSGMNNTFIMPTGNAGFCVNAAGTVGARKLLNISDITFDGRNATGTLYGLRLGHNYRSFGALRRVRIDRFPGPGLYYRFDGWNQSYYDVYMSFNARNFLGSAIYIDGGVTGMLGIDWFNLQLENNGFMGSGVAGGIELPNSAIQNWKFFGGVWESNEGDAEARFTDCGGIHIYGLYLESEPTLAPTGLIFGGNTVASIDGLFAVGGVGQPGSAIIARNTAKISVDTVRCNSEWVNSLAIEGTAEVALGNPGLLFDEISVAAGASLKRMAEQKVTLVDAANIAVDAAKGTQFSVTLAGNRTVSAPTNPSIGQRAKFTIYQDGVGGRTLAWNAVFKVTWSNAGNVAGARSSVEFEYDGTNWNQVSAQAPYI